MKFLIRYPIFKQFINKAIEDTTDEELIEEKRSPSENIDKNYHILKKDTQDQLLQKIMEFTPRFFEHLIVELVVAMGYGGSIEDAGQAIGITEDEGIDGIIKEDVLGLENI